MTAKTQTQATAAHRKDYHEPVRVPFQTTSTEIWDKKYRLKNFREEPVDGEIDDTYRRVARALADVEEPEQREHWYEQFVWALQNGAIPAGRIISNAGAQDYKPATSTINCTVSGTIRDSMDDILGKVHEAGLTLKAGCVAPGTWVYTEQGRVPAERAVAERHVHMLCYDKETGRYEYRPVQRHLTTHVPREEQIELVSNGAALRTSIKHPVLVYRQGRLVYVRADEVDTEDALVHRHLPWEAEPGRARQAWFAGAHLGDGSAYEKHKKYSPARRRWEERAQAWGRRLVFKIRAAEQAVVERYAAFFREFCGCRAQAMPATTVNGAPVWDFQVASFEASQAAGLIDDQIGKKTEDLRVPAWVARNPEGHFLPFLAGLIDTDGTVSTERGSVTVATQSHDFAEELQELLALFGVHGGITRRQPRNHSYGGREVRDSGGAMLKISDSGFLQRVAGYLADPGKRDRIHEHASQAGQYDRYVLPESLRKALEEAAETLDHRQRSQLGFYHGYHRQAVVSRVWLDRWEARFPELTPLIAFARTLRPLDTVRRDLGLPETFYDFEVAEHHNYVAGNHGLMVIHNCGIGYDFSTLRPRGAFVAGAGAITSGPLSFMDIYDRMCFTISSAGGRRGAQMATFDIGHPDVTDFVRAKREDGRLRQFNMSLLITHEFMEAVKNDAYWQLAFPVTADEVAAQEIDLNDGEQVVWREWPIQDDYIVNDSGLVACKIYETRKARHLWNAIMSSTYDYAEPGFILIDQYNDMNNNWYAENIRATNPCVTGDTLILTDRGEVPIQEVVGESLQVWNGAEWSEVTPKVTGHDRTILRVHFSTGSYLDCTLNHKFVLADGTRVEARELAAGDELQGFRMPSLEATGTDGIGQGGAVSGLRVVAKEAMGQVDTVYCFTEPKNHTGIFNGVMTGQCGEQGLPPYGACLLGSVNLTQFVHQPFTENAEFDWARFREVVSIFTRMLDNVADISGLPLDKQQEEIRRKRRHGMGYLGLGSTLAMLRMTYGDPPSVEFTEQVSRVLAETGWETGVALAEEKGAAPILDETFTVNEEMLRKRPEMREDGYSAGDPVSGRVLMARYSRYMQQFPEGLRQRLAESGCRFTHHTSIAPTGTIALSLANNASNGIEPSFAHKYLRNVVQEGKKSKGQVEVCSYELLAYREHVDPEADPEAEDPAHRLPEYFVDANTIHPWQHVEIQAAAQKWIDSSISKTINVPQDFEFDQFKDIYLYAYEQGLKGCTTFRFNPEAFQGVLVQEKDLQNTYYRFELEDGSTVELRGDEEVEYDGEVHSAANLFDALKEGYYGRF